MVAGARAPASDEVRIVFAMCRGRRTLLPYIFSCEPQDCLAPCAGGPLDNEFVHATLRRRKLFACCGYGSLGACLAAWGASIFGHQSVLCVRAFTSRASGVESGAHMPAASRTSVLLVMLSLRSAAPSPSTLASAGNQDDFLAARVMMRRKPDAALPDVCSVVCV